MTLYKFCRFEQIYKGDLFGKGTDLYKIDNVCEYDTLLNIVFPHMEEDSEDEDADYQHDSSIFQVQYWNRRTDVMNSLRCVGSIGNLGYYTIQLLPERALFQNKELKYDYRIRDISEIANRVNFNDYVERMKEEAGYY